MLGYIAYVLICAFGFLQLFDMVRGLNRNLGHVPVISLLCGLALLQVSIMRDGAPLYIQIGNAVSFTGTFLSFLWSGFIEVVDHALDELDAWLHDPEDARYTLTYKGFRATDMKKDYFQDEPVEHSHTGFPTSGPIGGISSARGMDD